MGRADEFRPSNPAERFYDWRSDENAFCFYDKESEARIAEPLPFNFLILRQSIRITGVDKQTNQQILSNEVRSVSKEPLNVRLRDGKVLSTGYWSEIKEEVNSFGGHYTKIIFAMDAAGSMICLRIRGKGLQAWGDTIGKSQRRQRDEWIVVNGYQEDFYDEKPFSWPTFEFGGSISKEMWQRSDDLYKELEEYYKGISAPQAQPIATSATSIAPATLMPTAAATTLPFAAVSDDDDLPF
ncbi:hypothetical protein LZD49_26235 [Dyadobacter sp. CY261]|uniref:hypothetical protein n=1 Tax=Dyadobacter sp. CY261 TaxID=2907203 RepID=UPI001F2E6CD3|nr:hypothetical protein [Dyadobacter sp. CY261]MCF0074008.1 hypothetical protein [Dyadobacter sp. CY261]